MFSDAFLAPSDVFEGLEPSSEEAACLRISLSLQVDKSMHFDTKSHSQTPS